MSIQKLRKQCEYKEQELKNLEDQIYTMKKRQSIPCSKCGYRNVIGQTTIIQTYHYTPPHGCIGGDYYTHGELNFHCNKCGVRNRILFNDFELPYELRTKWEWNSESLFRSSYKHCFLEVVDETVNSSDAFVLNYYVDENRKRFGLFDREKAIEGYKRLVN